MRLRHFRTRLQLEEAFGELNRWFCSQAYGRQIEDAEMLVSYYVRSGGAANFAKRFDEAMGDKNRWFCSEFYFRDIRDPEVLWDYYINYAPARAAACEYQLDAADTDAELYASC
jgi:hypothetical protein